MLPPSESDSAFCSDPLISCFITLFLLILLYFPQDVSLRIFLSPVVIVASFILLSLLRLGVAQRIQTQKADNEKGSSENVNKKETDHHSSQRNNVEQLACNKGEERSFEQSFIEWDVGAPLEVIYEEHEGQLEEDHDGLDLNQNECDTDERLSCASRPVDQRYPISLSLCFPESDSDSSSDGDFAATGFWGSPERVCFRWEDQNDGDELIEIALDKKGLDLHGEEDSLIEIDVSSANGLTAFTN